MMSMTLDKVIETEGYQVGKTHHSSIAEAKKIAGEYDLVLCPQNFVGMFSDCEAKGTKVVGLTNVMSQKEMIEKLEGCGLDLKG